MMKPPSWRVAAASVVGTSHVKSGQPCQDAHEWRVLPSGFLIAAVADGAGSAALAEIGATLAARAAVQALAEALSPLAAGADTNPGNGDDLWRDYLTAACRIALLPTELTTGGVCVRPTHLGEFRVQKPNQPDAHAQDDDQNAQRADAVADGLKPGHGRSFRRGLHPP